jgi:hypothetical protein
MQHSISVGMHQSTYATEPHPVFLVDGEPLNLWLFKQLSTVEINCKDHFFDVDTQNLITAERGAMDVHIQDLVPAQGWLIDDDDMKTAWRRINPDGVGLTTIVPLLICPDDVDLTCNVIVVEQETSTDLIHWNRFGFAMDKPYDSVGATVQWFKKFHQVDFKRTEYCTALVSFQALCGETWIQNECCK